MNPDKIKRTPHKSRRTKIINIRTTPEISLWNIYDENRNFVQTKCKGNFDEFQDRQYENFKKEMRK